MTKRAQEAEAKRDEWRKKWRTKQQEVYAVQTELESQKELNKKLTAQVNKDFENSSDSFLHAGPWEEKDS